MSGPGEGERPALDVFVVSDRPSDRACRPGRSSPRLRRAGRERGHRLRRTLAQGPDDPGRADRRPPRRPRERRLCDPAGRGEDVGSRSAVAEIASTVLGHPGPPPASEPNAGKARAWRAGCAGRVTTPMKSASTRMCGEVGLELVGQRLTLAGWVDTRRDHGGLVFVDLRDASGVSPAGHQSGAGAGGLRGRAPDPERVRAEGRGGRRAPGAGEREPRPSDRTGRAAGRPSRDRLAARRRCPSSWTRRASTRRCGSAIAGSTCGGRACSATSGSARAWSRRSAARWRRTASSTSRRRSSSSRRPRARATSSSRAGCRRGGSSRSRSRRRSSSSCSSSAASTATTRSPSASGTRICAPTACRRSPSSTWRWPSRTRSTSSR